MHYIETQCGLVLEVDDTSIWPEAKRLTKAEGQRRLRDEALATLRALSPCDIHAVLVSVSATGMSRKVRLFAFPEGQPRNLTSDFARVLGWRHDGCEWLLLSGCGMDMVWHAVECVNSAAGTKFNSRGLL